MEFKNLASVAGKSGLFKVLTPTRTGVVLESLDEQKKKMVASMHTKVSILSEISIYTTDAEGSRPLEDVMKMIHNEFEGDTGLSGSSAPDELKSFMRYVLPEYDETRVYVSDIKKLINWYNHISQQLPEVLTGGSDDASTEEDQNKNKGADNNEGDSEVKKDE